MFMFSSYLQGRGNSREPQVLHIVNELRPQAKTSPPLAVSFLRALTTQSKELKHVRLHGKVVSLLDLTLKGVKVVMWNLHALDILARGTNEVVMMVVRMKKFISLHTVEDVDLGKDLIVS